MVLCRFNFIKHLSYRSLHKHICKMNQAYLRHCNDSERFELTFQYVDSSNRVNRQFNFCRQVSESVSCFTQRVATNVEKIVKKKTKNESQTVPVAVSVDGEVVEDEKILCGDVFSASSSSNITLKVSDQNYKVVINSPWVIGITLPTSILAGFPVYPVKFESVYMDKKLSNFQWFKSADKNNWSLVGEGFMYNTVNSDIGNFLKLVCVPKNSELEGPASEAVSTVQVQAGPGFCPFESRHLFTKNKCEQDSFRVVSYNILADLYCDSDFTRQVLHPYCPEYALSIDYRKQLFIKEITGYNGDVICLQEVDKKIFTYDLEPIFDELGYGSDFCQKRDQVAEGVTCFFDRSKFKQVETFRLVFADEFNTNPLFSDIWERIDENEKLRDRIMDRSSVLQVVVLKNLNNEEVLVVGNTHLYSRPDADHIRLLQGAAVVRYLEDVVNSFKKKCEKRVSLVLCGDFNSVPESGIYQLYTTGSVPEDHIDFQSNPEEAVKTSLSQPFRLKSACGTPKYTNFTAQFADCLDYIYYECDNLEVSQVVPFPSLEELNQHTALPSIVAPSDHIALISDLKWTKPAT